MEAQRWDHLPQGRERPKPALALPVLQSKRDTDHWGALGCIHTAQGWTSRAKWLCPNHRALKPGSFPHHGFPMAKRQDFSLRQEQKLLQSIWNGYGLLRAHQCDAFIAQGWRCCRSVAWGCLKVRSWDHHISSAVSGLIAASITLALGRWRQTKPYQAVLGGGRPWTPILWRNSSCKAWFDSEWKQTQHCLHRKTPQSQTICLRSAYMFGLASDFYFSFEKMGPKCSFPCSHRKIFFLSDDTVLWTFST